MEQDRYFSQIICGEATDSDYLYQVSEKYPWFGLCRIALAHSLRKEGRISEWKESRKANNLLFTAAGYNNFKENSIKYISQNSSITLSAIDTFLNKDLGRIKADENTPEEDLAHINSEEIISESLAEILVAQQHFDKAIDMYGKLSLKFPEKSVYFATRIDSLMEKFEQTIANK